MVVTKSVLPIELTFFRAAKEGQDVMLTWQTASEKNNDYFSIERSFNGLDFDPIGFVAGQGDSFEVNDYWYSDKGIVATTPSELVYYRLRQTDYDGTSVLSETAAVELEIQAGFAFEQIEETGNGTLAIHFTHTKANPEIVEFPLFNLAGKRLAFNKILLEDGDGMTSLQTYGYPAGIYIVAAQIGSQTIPLKVFLKG